MNYPVWRLRASSDTTTVLLVKLEILQCCKWIFRGFGPFGLGLGSTIALLHVEIGAANGTKTAAIGLAEHNKRRVHDNGVVDGLAQIDDAILEGPNAFVFSNGDPVSAPKLVKEFITAAEKDKKTSPLTIKAGIMDGAVQSVEEVKALADILPREQLIAKIMGCLNSQATALAYVIQAIADKKAEAGEQ